ncbi:MAG: geranylgeranylglycerol-phosphate geranylgeranyltransferase [candidate division KSB1 bacterium]|nr:geranylgeranylglycerol-phosphate geranylgeranyltransferase [candidate division KSB1 bacterium]MDZ7346419.1 geranylgeranylglycerol-phosphate geranylgeranyltransferase [candidate division KSB1 bacterium]MDZ7371740.1 geranylgeranylglycerol-phosphate geranylgeranyltransferase [candidate division KSB1 bacterium]
MAAHIADASKTGRSVWFAALSAALITAAANAINDYFDIEIDRINRPNRPLPSGKIERSEALWFAAIFFFLGIALSFGINRAAVVLVIVASLLLIVYSPFFKRMVLLGNLLVSLTTAMAMFYGGVAAGSPRKAIVPAIFAFFVHFAREIIKDMEDIEGDSRFAAMTLPVRHGNEPAKLLATVVLLDLIAFSFFPFALGLYGRWYLYIVLVIDLIFAGIIIALWLTSRRKALACMSVLLKLCMVLGLFAIYAGRWN